MRYYDHKKIIECLTPSFLLTPSSATVTNQLALPWLPCYQLICNPRDSFLIIVVPNFVTVTVVVITLLVVLVATVTVLLAILVRL